MFHLVHPSFGALADIKSHGRALWDKIDGRKPMIFDTKFQALSTAADLKLGGEEQFCIPVPVK